MRVIQVNKFHYLKGGAERYYLDLSQALQERGHQVEHLSMQHPRNLPSRNSDRFVEQVDYHSPMAPWQKLRQGLRTIYNPEAARHARRLAQDRPRPVAHLHNIYHQLSPSVVSAFAREGVGIVQTLHDYKLVCPAYLLMTEGKICERCRGGRFWQAFQHRCLLQARGPSLLGAAEAYFHQWCRTYSKVTRFLCPSKFIMEKVASFGIPRERLVHLPYFVPVDRFTPGTEKRDMVCVFVGRLSREKGIATLVEAMARLPRGRLMLHVLGEGPLRESLEQKVRRNCPDRVRFLGHQSGKRLQETIRRAAFAVAPSEWFENLPFAILEAFALGTPVVGAQIGGIPELVDDGITGKLHESGDPDSLADALLWMSSPEADLAGMGKSARQRIERNHSVEKHLDRLLSIYEEVAA